jgi:acetylornithine/succinyldiaminopimelate/putrescine aminotransferase
MHKPNKPRSNISAQAVDRTCVETNSPSCAGLSATPPRFCVTHAENDLLFTADGDRYIDLLMGSGTVFLGHVNPDITRAIEAQLRKLWNTGVLQTDIGMQANSIVNSFFPSSHRLAALYATGMEAAEFAMRVARLTTGRPGVIGFDNCMHGKSMATAHLGWENQHVDLPRFYRLPFVPNRSEHQILEELSRILATREISVVFLEALQGSNGGHTISADFYQSVALLCSEYGTLFAVDEIFTGFYRTGTPFFYQTLGSAPDIILIGKAMGNGFPVSGVVLNKRIPVTSGMLPGSTYAQNPLAAAAVCATLQLIQKLDMVGNIAKIESAAKTILGNLNAEGIPVRGKGALWILEIAPPMNVGEIASRILCRGVLVSQTGRFIRLLFPATIAPEHLNQACLAIRDVCLDARRQGSG